MSVPPYEQWPPQRDDGWGAAPGGYPPAQLPAPPAPPSGRSRARWWLLGTAVVLVVAALSGGVGYVMGRHHGSATPAAAPTTWAPPTSAGAASTPPGYGLQSLTPAVLPALLLTPDAIDSLLGTSGLMIDRDSSEPLAGTADLPECMGMVAPAESAAYSQSGWVALRVQQLRQSGEQFQNDVTQAVVSFPSAAAANSFIDTATDRWSSCAGKSVSATLGDGLSQTWQVATPSNTDGMLTVSTTNPAVGWGCQRAVTARRNVVIDVRICSATGSSRAPDLATRIGQNIRGG